MNDKTVCAIARRLSRTPAQVLLRWSLEKGVLVIPKSQSDERIRSNFDVLDFTLSEEDVLAIDALRVENSRYCLDPTGMN